MRLGATLAALGGVLACSPGTTDTPSPATSASYGIVFPSTSTAVASETLEVLAFDATNARADESDCLTLITKLKSGADLPKAPVLLGRTDETPVCKLLAPGAVDALPSSGVLPALTYGKRSLLAITRRERKDFLVGCANANVTAAEATIEIPVLPVDETVVVPTTTCATVADKCAGRCP